MFLLSYRKGEHLATLLNVIGMALAFASVYLLFLQSWYNLTFNRFIPYSERIYRVEYNYADGCVFTAIASPIARSIVKDNPYLEGYARGGNLYFKNLVTADLS